MKTINKIITRLFWGGYDLRVGLNTFIPIPKIHIFIIPLIFLFGYKWIMFGLYPYESGLFTQMCLIFFFFMMYVIFIHWKIYPVKFKDMTDYQKWIYGKGLKYNSSGLRDTLTKEEWEEWEYINKNKLIT